MLTEIHDYQIRPAEDGDLGIIAEILYQHYQPYDWWQVVNSKVEETTWLRITTDDLRQNTSEGAECASFVIEDAGVLAGAVRYVELKKGLDPLPAPDLMLGENASEAEDLDNTIFKEEMMKLNGTELGGFKRFIPPESFKVGQYLL
ncbi:hypothetical protein QFC22_006544 [Naganishia vaughanmartiniae]|uniref:Uncharacterized protein n=1 Tax=Naganishia vaughanmartiniae TaxID=1424756 RepID=A0ACC2WJ52_9TREE|nr:hypothetical protein QFC22_006544 [Naganishia vaughanmartiniae]